MIEDPREAERRKQLGVEDERGCSREDLGNALNEVHMLTPFSRWFSSLWDASAGCIGFGLDS